MPLCLEERFMNSVHSFHLSKVKGLQRKLQKEGSSCLSCHWFLKTLTPVKSNPLLLKTSLLKKGLAARYGHLGTRSIHSHVPAQHLFLKTFACRPPFKHLPTSRQKTQNPQLALEDQNKTAQTSLTQPAKEGGRSRNYSTSSSFTFPVTLWLPKLLW